MGLMLEDALVDDDMSMTEEVEEREEEDDVAVLPRKRACASIEPSATPASKRPCHMLPTPTEHRRPPILRLEIKEQAATLTRTFKEPVDIILLDRIINSDLLLTTFRSPYCKQTFSNEKEQLLEYRAKIINGYAHVLYIRPNAIKFGRIYPARNLGGHSIRREIRHTLFRDTMYDIDLANCHPSIIYQLCKAKGLPHKYLGEYVNKREEWLKIITDNLNVTRDAAKQLVIRILYHGKFNTWKSEHGLQHHHIPPEIDNFVNGLTRELEAFSKAITVVNSNLVQQIKQRKRLGEDEKRKMPARIVSYFAQEHEFRMLEIMYQTAVEGGYLHNNVVALCCDGIMLEKRRLPSHEIKPLLKRMEQRILEKTGFTMQIEQKEMKQGFTEDQMTGLPPPLPSPPNSDEDDSDDEEGSETSGSEGGGSEEVDSEYAGGPVEVANDRQACTAIKRLYGDRIMRTPQGWFAVVLEPIPHWEYGTSYVRDIIGEANICRRTKQGLVSYSSQKTGLNNIMAFMEDKHKLFPLNRSFIADVNRATKGKVFFEDYYFDLEKQEWVDIIESGIIPLVYIKRLKPDFDAITDDDMETFKRDVLCLMASDDDLNMLFHALARAVGGYKLDKVWYIFKGVRHSAKGTVQSLTKFAFADYCTEAPPPCCKSFHSGDASANRWLLTKHQDIARITFSNESVSIDNKPALLDGNFIKNGIASGGDVLDARRHNGDETDVVMNTTWFMSFNTMPVCEPRDAIQNMIPFVFPFKFLDESERDGVDDISYRDVIPGMRDEVQYNERWRDIFVKLVLLGFKPYKVKLTVTAREEYQQLMVGNSTEPAAILSKHFRRNPMGWVSSDELYEIFKMSVTTKEALGKFLSARDFLRISKMKNGQRQYGYQGLELMTEEPA